MVRRARIFASRVSLTRRVARLQAAVTATRHTWWDEGISHVYLTAAAAKECGLDKGYRMFTMPELGEGIDPLIALYAVTGGPTAAVLAMVKDDTVEAAPAAKAAAPAAAAAEDEVDLWGDEPLGDEYTAEEQANQDRLDAIAAAHKAKKAAAGKLKQVIGKSKIVLDVKPWDDETDLAAMEQACRDIVHPTNKEAIDWQASQLEDVGYGIKKLRIMVQVWDDEVSVEDDLVEVIQGFDEWVQSCDVFAFNKV
jgi:elongation factor 1-beta